MLTDSYCFTVAVHVKSDSLIIRLRLRLNLFLSARIIVIYNIKCIVQCINKCCKCVDNSY